MSAREIIFHGIRSALAPLKERTACPDFVSEVAEPVWLAGETDALALFRKRLAAAGGMLFDSPSACRAWLEKESVRVLYIAPELQSLAVHFEGAAEITHEYTRSRVDEIDAAITPAAGAIAETGTLILTDEKTPDRLAALAPWRHIAALPQAALHRSIGEALAALPDDPNVIWVTGPSKTADVEGILIQGVHGPGQQACLLI